VCVCDREEMTEMSVSVMQLYAVTTTTDEMQCTNGHIMTLLSSRGTEFYMQCTALVIGIVGTATNALILYAMIASKQCKKHVLIFNQNSLDFVNCVLMIITYSLKLSNIYVSGTIAYLLCMMVLSESLISSTLIGSVINLVAITTERYLKIAHSTWSQKHLRKWMRYMALAFPWLTPIIYNVVLVSSSYLSVGMDIPNADLIGGPCYAYKTSESKTDSLIMIKLIGGFMIFFYVSVLLIFSFCYWHILLVIRRQRTVMASHGTASGSSAGQTQTHQIQSSVIKTMILVCAFFAISWLPNYLCIFLLQLSPSTAVKHAYYASVFFVFLYTATNPFIYVAKFDPVKKIMVGLFSCKKPSEQFNRNTQNASAQVNYHDKGGTVQ